MPVLVVSDRYNCGGSGSYAWPRRKPQSRGADQPARRISVGLINNMPKAAFAATQSQFLSVLERASGGIEVHLSLYSLLEDRGPELGGGNEGCYSGIEDLWDAELDGIIVTGKEPETADIRDERCWPRLTRLLEWARERTFSAVWSCFAAHAAVLHLDDIGRRRNAEKQFGVFECMHTSSHPMLQGVPASVRIPHSRWNSLCEEDLVSRGYSVLTRTRDRAVDMFVKDERSLFVFFQGHPEYDPDTLLREYRRDVGRYVSSESPSHPQIPADYFDGEIQQTLTALRERASCARTQETLAEVWSALETARVKDGWRSTATSIYRNWLDHIFLQKFGSSRP